MHLLEQELPALVVDRLQLAGRRTRNVPLDNFVIDLLVLADYEVPRQVAEDLSRSVIIAAEVQRVSFGHVDGLNI